MEERLEFEFGTNIEITMSDPDTGGEVKTKISFLGETEDVILRQVSLAVSRMMRSMGYLRGGE
jgi:hypothetical protein